MKLNGTARRVDARRADIPNSGVKDLEPLQRLADARLAGTVEEGQRDCVADMKCFSLGRRRTLKGISFGGGVFQKKPLDRSAVIVRVIRPFRASRVLSARRRRNRRGSVTTSSIVGNVRYGGRLRIRQKREQKPTTGGELRRSRTTPECPDRRTSPGPYGYPRPARRPRSVPSPTRSAVKPRA